MLDCFTLDQPELSVSELAERLSIHKSIASRIASTLRARRYLEVNPATRRYRIGRRVFELGQIFVRGSALNDLALPDLRALVAAVGHASHLAVLDGTHILISCCVESTRHIQVAVEPGARRTCYSTASGKVLLSYSNPTVLESVLQAYAVNGKFPKVGPRTITSVREFRKEIAQIRESGLAYNREESLPGVWSVAAPVLAPSGEIVASVTTLFPRAIVNDEELFRIGTAVKEAARKISRRIADEGAIADTVEASSTRSR